MAGNDAQNGAFLAAIRVPNVASPEDDISANYFPIIFDFNFPIISILESGKSKNHRSYFRLFSIFRFFNFSISPISREPLGTFIRPERVR